MKLIFDPHTHTISSGHAYSTVKENAEYAAEIGLEYIAITDHAVAMPGTTGFDHFNNLRILPKKVSFGTKSVNILTGVELNILDYKGNVDLPEKLCSKLQVVIASLHPPCIKFGTVDEITSALICTMKKDWIKIIGHPCDPRYPFDIEKVVKAAKETNTLLEINNSSFIPGRFRNGGESQIIEMLNLCKKYNNPIIVGSDSHVFCDVGNFDMALNVIEKSSLTPDLIVNADIGLMQKFFDIQYYIGGIQ